MPAPATRRSTPTSSAATSAITAFRAIRICFRPTRAPLVDGKQPNSSAHAEGGAVGGSYLFDGGYAGLAIARYASDYHVPTIEGAAIGTHLRLEQTKITSKGEFLPATSAIAAVRYWAGYTDYKHDEIGFTDIGVEAIAATFKKRTSEAKVEVESMPLLTPIGALTGIVGTQFSSPATRHFGRGAAVSRPHQNRGRLFLQRDAAHADAAHATGRPHRERQRRRHRGDLPGEFPAAAR